MKARMTMAAVFLAAVMIAAAVIPAATGDTGNADKIGTDTNPKYIIGTADKAVEVAGGVNAQIEFNRAAFSHGANVKFYVTEKPSSDDVDWTNVNCLTFTADSQNANVNVATTTEVTGATVKITETDVSEGIYDVKIESTAVFSAVILIKVEITESFKITESSPEKTTTQMFVWAANVCSEYFTGATISITDAGGNEVSSIDFFYETNYSLALSVKNGDNPLDGYVFYASGLPAGLSVTTDNKIGGKLATDASQPTEQQSFTVYAVLGGKVLSSTVTYMIGDKDQSDFNYKITKNDPNPGYTIIKTGESVTITATTTGKVFDGSKTKITAKIWNGNSATDLTTDYSKDESGNHTTSATFIIDKSRFNLGTYRVDMTYNFTANGQEKTVMKSMYIFVVGNIYHADLDPAVTTTP